MHRASHQRADQAAGSRPCAANSRRSTATLVRKSRDLDQPERKPDLQDLQPMDEHQHSSRHDENRTTNKKWLRQKKWSEAGSPRDRIRRPIAVFERPLQFGVWPTGRSRGAWGPGNVDGPIGHQGGG